MSVLTEDPRPGNFILSEANGALSRDAVTVDVPAATKLLPGQVLGLVTATGHYAPYDNANSDGSETAAGILHAALDNTAGLTTAGMAGVAVVRLAEVREADLVFDEGVDEDGAIVDLAAAHIVVRD
jgi:hypothetical protein